MFRKITVVLAVALAVTGCSSSHKSNDGANAEKPAKVTIVTHDSFKLADNLKAEFEKSSGYKLEILSPNDAGVMVNQLILTKDAPVADGVFGVDNTLAGKAIAAGVFKDYQSQNIPKAAAGLKLGEALNPIDFGEVCINADKQYFTSHNLELPKTIDDLVKPEYKDMLVIENPASSSPGKAFLIASVGIKGVDGYLDYWKQLKANGVKVVKGWTDAYTKEFSAGEGKGKYPLVLSYGSSPAAEVNKEGSDSATVSLPDTCFRQTEYAAVLKGAKNPDGAQKFIDFLLTKAVQETFPSEMFVYPVNPEAKIPETWAKFAKPAATPIKVDPELIAKESDKWVKDWTAAVLG